MLFADQEYDPEYENIVWNGVTQAYGWVVAYPVMQAYDRLALTDKLEVGEDRSNVTCICTSTFDSSKPMKQTQSFFWVLLGDILCDFPYLWGDVLPVRFQ